MKEHPIIFNGAMVRAILEGRKTQTRRPVKFIGHDIMSETDDGKPWPFIADEYGDYHAMRSPFGVPGDRLWVRETFAVNLMECATGPIPKERPSAIAATAEVVYRADGEMRDLIKHADVIPPWRPAIHMPRWACRETLIVERVWIERLQDISESGAVAEGCWRPPRGASGQTVENLPKSAREQFIELWDTIYGKTFPAASNPWVWCCEFRREKA